MKRPSQQESSCFRFRHEHLVALAAAAALALSCVASAASVAPHQSSRSASAANLEQNKRLAEDFFRQVLGKQDLDAAARYLREDYIQHNPDVPQGLKGFQDYFRAQFAKLTPEAKEALRVEVLHTVAEGDLVAIHVRISGKTSKGEPFDRTEFDLFRVEGGRLAEHWDATP